MARTPGSYAVTGVSKLPHVTVAFPGEHWSDRVASGAITPGIAVVPAGSATVDGKMIMRPAVAGDSGKASQVAIALRTVQVPDRNPGSQYNEALGPNEIMNLDIKDGEYVHAWYSGAFHLTLFDPADTYVPGDLIGWKATGARPTGITGTGSWKKSTPDITNIFEVIGFRSLGLTNGEGILTVRTLRGQF